ncbi:ATP-grasp domain-containing protein [Paenibacillus sp. LMG 31461]|uniref:ATP-grasp domain-containing protein n=1 Tax=Paenibacillus plantarum TaxID=2654975 RepID=A0ABX1XE41_9BACL|nr:ATP-grasp domain-containing protein [Paenibacillus plantarum]NOU66747.1 ATP-grasp domain-containing protein [Paenibacillus plantarum]
MKTVLFTAIGRRVQLIKHFTNAGVRVVGTDLNPDYAPASDFVSCVYQLPRFDDPDYIDRLLEICRAERVSIVIPLFEPELMLLAKQNHKFEAEGIDILVSGLETLRVCLDKYHMYQFFINHQISTPETYLPEQFAEKSDNWVVKPRRGMASKDVHFIDLEKNNASEWIQRVSSPIVQRFISGKEYTIDAYVDKQGKVRSVVPRVRLEVRAGEVSKTVTRKNDAIIRASNDVLRQLPFYGPVTLQGIIEDHTNRFYFTEINPRFGGGVPLTIQAGIPYAELILQKTSSFPELLPFQEDLVMLRYEEAVFRKE